LRVTRKPESKAYRATLRVIAIGFSVLGVTGFIFQLVSSSFQMVALGPVSRDVAIIVMAAIAAVALGVALYLRRRVLV